MVGDVILRKDDGWLKFTQPRRVIVTEKLEEVRKCLGETERLVNEKGWTAVGFVSYEAAPAFDSVLKVRPSAGFPLLWFGLYDSHETAAVLEESEILSSLEWVPDVERDVYDAAIQSIKERIAQGKTYQVNYTMRLSTDFETDKRMGADLWTQQLFSHLAHSQNRYAAFIDMGDWAVCSASHELFFELDGETITSRPMKGTVHRGRTTKEDKQNVQWLRASEKNRAENAMIVDMVRNDIGRIAKIGSVSVPQLFEIEKYPTLFQMTSTVQAATRASVTEIFSALFPCASITGAPKVSTMKIIAELEKSPRRVYTGSIGYIAPNRKARFNVAIRTALVNKKEKKAEYGIGGGIVWDSTSAEEYDEALLKARVLIDSSQPNFSLFETILWTPQEGYFLLERHIARILDSAEYFDFPAAQAEIKIRTALEKLSQEIVSPQRVKVILNLNGEILVEARGFHRSDKIFKVSLAKEPVNSNDRFLFHKTTNRGMYERVMVNGFDDTLLYNEKNELTEFTIGNLVVVLEDDFYTPPIECGLLAGTFRAHLLESRKVKEQIIRLNDLSQCRKIFLVNSLRKWVEVELTQKPVR